jgi:hypothetical protein
MRVTLEPNVYTQINTVADNYMIQNLGQYAIHVVISDTQPDSTVPYDFSLDPKCGISNSHVEGIVWGKPNGKYAVDVGIVEG